MDANEGVQSFNFEVGQKFKSFKEFESQLKHYQDAKLSQRRQSKQLQMMIWFSVNLYTHVFMETEILFPIPKDQDQIRGKHLNVVFTSVVQYQGKYSIIFHIYSFRSGLEGIQFPPAFMSFHLLNCKYVIM